MYHYNGPKRGSLKRDRAERDKIIRIKNCLKLRIGFDFFNRTKVKKEVLISYGIDFAVFNTTTYNLSPAIWQYIFFSGFSCIWTSVWHFFFIKKGTSAASLINQSISLVCVKWLVLSLLFKIRNEHLAPVDWGECYVLLGHNGVNPKILSSFGGFLNF